jgi:prepilin-type processing-associated H-X9-DG protein
MLAMEITFSCPNCGEVTLIGEEFVGQSGECRACGAMVTVPPVVLNSEYRVAVNLQPSASVSNTWRNLRLGCLVLVGLAIVVAFCLPAMRHAGPAARRMSSGNNLKQIALAMHNYHDIHGKFPRAYHLTENGERTLSWRVAILPYIEQAELRQRYRADEPWDSEANLLVGEEPISVYRNPGDEGSKPNQTSYMVITGPGTLFEEGKDFSFADCLDGSANTILAVEVINSGANWTQPIDLDIRNMILKINGGGFGISSPWKGGANVAFADGSVRFLPNDTLEESLRAMITRAGGEEVEIP